MHRKLATMTVIAVALAGFAPAGVMAHAKPAPIARQVPACTHEDGSGQPLCIWRGDARGNGVGATYIVYRGEFYYLDQEPAAPDWTGNTPPDPASLPLCQAADDAGCYYPGRQLGDRCDWVNAPDLSRTWFFNCDDPALNGVKP